LQERYADQYQYLKVEDQSVRILSPELQLLQVNVHILKHLIALGIGLRQFCDSARLYHTLSSQIDPDAQKKIYRDLGILQWAHAPHRTLVELIGLPITDVPFPYPKNIEINWIVDEILAIKMNGLTEEKHLPFPCIPTVRIGYGPTLNVILNMPLWKCFSIRWNSCILK